MRIVVSDEKEDRGKACVIAVSHTIMQVFVNILEAFKINVHEVKDAITLSDIPATGKLWTVYSFVRRCREGYLVDADGHGFYIMNGKMTNIPVTPSEVMSGNIKENFTHMIWFNN